MNINQIMKQAQQMQKKLQESQKEIESLEVEGTAGGGMVKITMTGKGTATKLSIDESIFSSDDKEMLEDLIVAAINDASSKSEEEKAKKMSEVSGGMQLPPGLNLPF